MYLCFLVYGNQSSFQVWGYYVLVWTWYVHILVTTRTHFYGLPLDAMSQHQEEWVRLVSSDSTTLYFNVFVLCRSYKQHMSTLYRYFPSIPYFFCYRIRIPELFLCGSGLHFPYCASQAIIEPMLIQLPPPTS